VTRSYLSIGDVLSLLRQEFPDITISKIRFLESQGLVNPERSASGYRKFYDHDVERLRWVLRQQREHFLPLKVIRDRLARNGDLDDSAIDEVDTVEPDEAAELDDDDAEVAAQDEAALVRVGSVRQYDEASDLAVGHVAGDADSWAEPELEVSLPEPVTAGVTASPLARASSTVVAESSMAAQSHAQSQGPTTRSEPAREGGSSGRSRQPAASRPAATREAEVGPSERPSTAPSPGGGLTLGELCGATGLSDGEVNALESFGLIEPFIAGGATYYGEEALDVAKLAAEFARFGIEPRHLRLFKNAADRELSLIEQVIAPLLRQRNPEARTKALESADELSHLGQALRAALLRRALRHHVGR
jgi:DNA-binding transcriptional MerR regulator